MSGKSLNKPLDDTELDDHWSWYEDWCADDDEIPELDEEDYETICNTIEQLFQHIRHQQEIIARFESEVMDSLGALKEDVAGFKSRKRKSEDSEPKRAKRVKKQASRT